MTSDPPTPDITDLPYDITAATLADITHAMRDASFDKVGMLTALNDRLYHLLHAEGDGTRMLSRQAEVLDSLFNLLVQCSINEAESSFTEPDGSCMPPSRKLDSAAKKEHRESGNTPKIHLETLRYALRTQRQTTDAIKTSHVIEYMRDLRKTFRGTPSSFENANAFSPQARKRATGSLNNHSQDGKEKPAPDFPAENPKEANPNFPSSSDCIMSNNYEKETPTPVILPNELKDTDNE
ncbi:MAG: hypothetical protein AAGB32_04570 [Pseudomonadota bacterium]